MTGRFGFMEWMADALDGIDFDTSPMTGDDTPDFDGLLDDSPIGDADPHDRWLKPDDRDITVDVDMTLDADTVLDVDEFIAGPDTSLSPREVIEHELHDVLVPIPDPIRIEIELDSTVPVSFDPTAIDAPFDSPTYETALLEYDADTAEAVVRRVFGTLADAETATDGGNCLVLGVQQYAALSAWSQCAHDCRPFGVVPADRILVVPPPMIEYGLPPSTYLRERDPDPTASDTPAGRIVAKIRRGIEESRNEGFTSDTYIIGIGDCLALAEDSDLLDIARGAVVETFEFSDFIVVPGDVHYANRPPMSVLSSHIDEVKQ